MKAFEEPEINVVYIEANDVMRASCSSGTPIPVPDPNETESRPD